MLKFISNIFTFFTKKRRKFYELHPEKQIRCRIPVISVGNISVGGTGKTPFCSFFANKLISFGIKPAIIGKGYKRRSKGLVIVSDGNNLLASVEDSGDEMFLLANSVKAPIIVSQSKYLSALKAQDQFDIDCIIVDDGFQHLKLYRDIDIVLVDDDIFNWPYLLPKGRMREPLEVLAKADFICYFNDELRDLLLIFNSNLIKLFVEYSEPYNIFTNQVYSKNNFAESQEKIILLSGIAKPLKFEKTVTNMGINILKHIIFPDHHYYKIREIRKIIENTKKLKSDVIITTEKDAVKLVNYKDIFIQNKIKIIAIPLKLNISESDFDRIIKNDKLNFKNIQC